MELSASNVFIASILSITFATAHLLTIAFIAFNDLSGNWKQYALSKNRHVNISTYLAGVKNFLFDFLLIFIPINLAVVSLLDVASAEWSWTSLPVAVCKIAFGYFCGKLWSFAVHYVMHKSAWLYKNIHKRHHTLVSEMAASHAWYDSLVEYLIMEVPNLLLPVFIARVHWLVLVPYFAYHGFSAAVDHSGFKVNFVIDGEYHFYHHSKLLVNYAEMETIDLLFGTHHSQSDRAKQKKEVSNPIAPGVDFLRKSSSVDFLRKSGELIVSKSGGSSNLVGGLLTSPN
jgi:hypothetical protein